MSLFSSSGIPIAQVLPLIRTSNLVIQLLVMLGYLLGVALNPVTDSAMTWADRAMLAGMVTGCLWTFRARNVRSWRCAVILFYVSDILAFKLQILTIGERGGIWSLLVAIMVNFGITTLIPRLPDYLFIIVFGWAVLCYGGLHGLIGPDLIPVLQILILGCLLSGAFMNYTHMRTLFDTLRLKEGYRIQAETDALTGIANRRALINELQRACDQPSDRGAYFVMLDIDNFKRINDELGHDRGDEVLKSMAASFGLCCPGGCYGRLGGEEFGIVFQDSTEQEVLEGIRQLLAETLRATLPFSFSAGLTALSRGITPSEILRLADQQLYLAKRTGKARLFANDNLQYRA